MYMRSLEVPVNRFSYVYYQDVLQAVVRRAYEIKTHIPQVRTMMMMMMMMLGAWSFAIGIQS
jgi:hypothetical protein